MEPELVHPTMPLPASYSSLVSREEKISFALEQYERARSLGLNPVAASVAGSVLRGQDTQASDMDGIVLVSDKGWKAQTWNNGVQVQSIENFTAKLTFSIPYSEMILSPFLVADPRWAPYLRAQRIDSYKLARHAAKFIRHSNDRPAVTDIKKYRHSFAAWYLLTFNTPLIPRRYLYPVIAPSEYWAWLDAALTGEI